MPKPHRPAHVAVALNETDLRLAKLLAERKEKEGGSYLKLEAAILRAVGESSGTSTPRGVDRRKLKSIVESDPSVVISIAELRSLDRYLERFGQGLALQPLFERPDVLGRLAESNEVRFLLGSRHAPDDPLKMNISQWDVLAMAEIQRGVYGFSRNVAFDIRDVGMPEPADPNRPPMAHAEIKELLDDRGPSRVALGSSRGNPASEVMLSRMAGVPPYDAGMQPGAKGPPFHFIWSQSQHHVLPSRFHMSGEQATQVDPRKGVEILKRGAAGFALPDGRIEMDELSYQREGVTYGICVAQRRRRGQIWLLAAGLTGPATYAASRWVRKMATRLHDAPKERDSAIYWSVIKAEAFAQEDRGAEGPSYRLGEESIVCGPETWDPGGR